MSIPSDCNQCEENLSRLFSHRRSVANLVLFDATDAQFSVLDGLPGHTSHSKGITVYLTESSAQRPALLLSVKRDLHTVLYLYFQ